MSRVRILRVLGNPKSKGKKFSAREATQHTKRATTKKLKKLWAKVANKERKKIGRRRAIRAADSVVKRRAQPRFLVEGHRSGRLRYLTRHEGAWRDRTQAKHYRTAKEAQKAMRAHAPKAERLGFTRLQVVVA